MSMVIRQAQAPQAAANSVYARLVERLESVGDLTLSNGLQSVLHLPSTIKNIEDGCVIASESEIATQCFLVLHGQVVQYQMSHEFRRHITSLHTAGDVPNLRTVHRRRHESSFAAIGPVTIAVIPHEGLKDIIDRHSGVARGFLQLALFDLAIAHQWLVVRNDSSSMARVAHLFCELATRLSTGASLSNIQVPMPWKQVDIADACGLSLVHVNRIIQSLRAQGLVRWRGRMLEVQQWNELKAIAHFTPDYLQLK